jgi:hypothetical protein
VLALRNAALANAYAAEAIEQRDNADRSAQETRRQEELTQWVGSVAFGPKVLMITTGISDRDLALWDVDNPAAPICLARRSAGRSQQGPVGLQSPTGVAILGGNGWPDAMPAR